MNETCFIYTRYTLCIALRSSPWFSHMLADADQFVKPKAGKNGDAVPALAEEPLHDAVPSSKAGFRQGAVDRFDGR